MKRVALSVCLFAAMLAAQPGPPQGGPQGRQRTPNLDAVKSALQLTDAQVSQLTQLRAEQRQAMQGLAEQLRTRRTALQQAIQQSGADPAAIGRMVLELEGLRKQMDQARDTLRSRATNLLTTDQRAKLKTLEEALQAQGAIRQAMALNLLEPPERPEGDAGRGGPRGPRGGGRRF